jgi:uncharacterized protein (TIGR03663 family)
MRSDVPLAVLFLAAVGFGYRALLTGRRRHVVAAGLFVGMALTTKENALLYLACTAGTGAVAVCWPATATWLGAGHGDGSATPRARLTESAGSARRHVRHHLPAVPLALLAALLPVVFFFAPRGPVGEPTLAAAFAGEVGWMALVERATLGSWETFRASFWVAKPQGSFAAYAPRLGAYLLVGALPAVIGAGVAAVRELRTVTRPLVVPFLAWGVAALLGYPLVADIPAPWLSLHIALPLLVPAAVGWVTLAERGWLRPRRWLDAGWWRRLAGYRNYALAALVVLSAVHVPVVLAVSSVTPPLYVNVLAQTAQPADDLNPLAATVEDAADDSGVLYYGDAYSLPNESLADHPPDRNDEWLGWWVSRLPMAWYVERAGAPTGSAGDRATLEQRASVPPVVFAAPAEDDEISSLLQGRGYTRTTYDLGRYHDEAVVVFVDEERLDVADGKSSQQ